MSDESEKRATVNINVDVTTPEPIPLRDDDSTISVRKNWFPIESLGFSWNDLKDKLSVIGSVQSPVSATFISTLEFIQTVDLLQWTKSLTEGAATTYDKSMDRIGEVIRIHGNEHRLFDGGHTLWGSWVASDRAAEIENDDGFERLVGWGEAYLKDLTTSKGMPLVTIDKESFDQWAESLSGLLPVMDRNYLYDLLSTDALELLASGVSAAGVVFALKTDDQQKLAELLGAMGISSIISANPILGLLMIATTAYSYRKNQNLDVAAMLKGGSMTAVSAALFAILGLPVLVELVIVVTLSTVLKKYVVDNVELANWIREKVAADLKKHAQSFLDIR